MMIPQTFLDSALFNKLLKICSRLFGVQNNLGKLFAQPQYRKPSVFGGLHFLAFRASLYSSIQAIFLQLVHLFAIVWVYRASAEGNMIVMELPIECQRIGYLFERLTHFCNIGYGYNNPLIAFENMQSVRATSST